MTTTKKSVQKPNNAPLIGVVGVCSSGKSTLIAGLEKYGLRIRHIAQEHSYVQDMWRRLRNPDILIYLDVSFEMAQSRRKLSWTKTEYQTQIQRLNHARTHADLVLDTDKKTPAQIVTETVNFLQEIGALNTEESA